MSSWKEDYRDKAIENLQNRIIVLERLVLKPVCEIALDPRDHNKHSGYICCCGVVHECKHLEHHLYEFPSRTVYDEIEYHAHCIQCHISIRHSWRGNYDCLKAEMLSGVCPGPGVTEWCAVCAEIAAKKLIGGTK